MTRSWYLEAEDEIDDRNESFGRDYVERMNKCITKSNTLTKLHTYEGGQLSLFEPIQKETSQETTSEIKLESDTENNIRLTKRDETLEEDFEENCAE